MTLTSMHTHTVWCDGRGGVDEFCRTAFHQGFTSIGFSAHAPVEDAGIRSSWHLQKKYLMPYIDDVLEARHRWMRKITVYAGLEVDYVADRMGPADTYYRSLELDYIIGSVHYVPNPQGGNLLAVDCEEKEFPELLAQYGGDGTALACAYWAAVDGMIQAGGFDILGHLDLIKVNNRDEKYFSAGSTAYRLAWRSLIPRIAAGGFTVEINTGGIIRRRIEEPYPAWEIRVAMNAEGIPAVITSDAHQPEHLGGYYDRARRSLIEADYTSHRIFTGRTAQGATWREESLAPVAPS